MEWRSEGNEKEMQGKSLGGSFAPKLIVLLCVVSFCIGMDFTNRMWSNLETYDDIDPTHKRELHVLSQDCEYKPKVENGESRDIMGEVAKTYQAIQSLDKTISSLEMELAVAWTAKLADLNGSPILEKPNGQGLEVHHKAFVMIGINTNFSSRKR